MSLKPDHIFLVIMTVFPLAISCVIISKGMKIMVELVPSLLTPPPPPISFSLRVWIANSHRRWSGVVVKGWGRIR